MSDVKTVSASLSAVIILSISVDKRAKKMTEEEEENMEEKEKWVG